MVRSTSPGSFLFGIGLALTMIGCPDQPRKPLHWPVGHAPDGLHVARWVVAVDTSLSMKGYIQAGKLSPFLDALRESVHANQASEAPFAAFAVVGSGLVPWEARQSEAQAFLNSLKGDASRFCAPNNDLVTAIRQMAGKLDQPNVCGILVTDLIQSVKADGSDATGVGLALADWIKGDGKTHRGLAVVRFDVPFSGNYYPEKPQSAPFPLKAKRPLYLVILAPSPALSSGLAWDLIGRWQNQGGSAAGVGVADLTPDFTRRIQVDLQGDKLPGFRRSPFRGHVLELFRQGGTETFECTFRLPTFPEAPDLFKQKPQCEFVSGTPKATCEGKGRDGQFVIAYEGDGPLRSLAGKPDTFRFHWSSPTPAGMPGWVLACSATGDTAAEVLPKGQDRARTLNLEPILETAQRNGQALTTASIYIQVSRSETSHP